MRLVSIASGSSGNCIYIGSERTHILVDAGISNKRIEQGLNDIGIKGSELDGVLITHEHSDHVKGLGVLARKHGVPIYSTRETLEEIKTMKKFLAFVMAASMALSLAACGGSSASTATSSPAHAPR